MATSPGGEAVPVSGPLPSTARARVGQRSLGVYVHVPYCASRCGYCDFNTYTAAELGAAPGAAQGAYLAAAVAEIKMARETLGDAAPPLATVFFGGGTPTLLPADALGGIVSALEESFGFAPNVEITIEANPETITPRYLEQLLAAKFNRLSLGMQSAQSHVLAVLDRVHTAGRAVKAVEHAHSAGFGQISLDLIYGTPGESLSDWRASVETAIAAEPNHISAYALVVESGTRMGAQVRRGVLPLPDDDDLADKYQLADSVLGSAGFSAYEVSNWARDFASRCRHNVAYWRSDDWWGIGPGAHSHIAGVRWWNVRHPARYTAAMTAGLSPAEGREVLTDEQRRVERVLLELRLAEGLPQSVLTATETARLAQFPGSVVVADDTVRLTPHGRLLADGVVRQLLD